MNHSVRSGSTCKTIQSELAWYDSGRNGRIGSKAINCRAGASPAGVLGRQAERLPYNENRQTPCSWMVKSSGSGSVLQALGRMAGIGSEAMNCRAGASPAAALGLASGALALQ